MEKGFQPSESTASAARAAPTRSGNIIASKVNKILGLESKEGKGGPTKKAITNRENFKYAKTF